MNLSRRHFLTRTSTSAAALPFLLNADIDYCEAATVEAFDFSMGFPEDAIRLCFNENTLGPSPKAIEGARASIPGSYRYALGGLLRPFLAEYHDIDKEWILMGNGSTEVLTLAPLAYMRGGGNVVSSLETWAGMLTVADNMAVAVKRVGLLKDKGYAYDIDGLLGAVDSDTRLFLVVTPNNPTGTTLSYAELKKIADALSNDVLFVIDQAYVDYEPDGKTGIDLLKEGFRNVLVTRTFSKAHALAGLRCGYGLGHPDILKEITKFGCGPGSTNIAAFGAIQGALADPAHAERSRAYVEKTKTFYKQQCDKLGLKMVTGPVPFALIEVSEKGAKVIYEELKKQRIFVSEGSKWHLPEYLRVSYGSESENQAFFRQLMALL